MKRHPYRLMRENSHVINIVILAAVYFLAGKLGLSLAFVHASATAVWPPTGLSLVAVLLLGYQVWPGIFLGAFLVNLTTDGSVATSVAIGLGNTMEALVGALLILRFARGREAFDQARNIFKFAALAGVMSTAISATLGVTSLTLGGFARWSDFGPIWVTWWLGDMVSDFIVAPLLLIWSKPFPRLKKKQIVEAMLLLFLIVFVGQSIFGGWFHSVVQHYPLEFISIPLLLWATFRFDQHGAATAALVMSGIAIRGTLRGFGPFTLEEPNMSLLVLQAFMGTITITTLVLAAVISERKRGEQALQFQKSLLHSQGEASIDGILVVSRGGKMISFNERFVKMWELPAEVVATGSDEAELRAVQDKLVHPEEFLARVSYLYEHPDEESREEILLKNGRSFDRYSAPVKTPDGTYLGRVWYFRDITERKRDEEKLKQKTIEAQEASRVKSEFVANVSHELRTPLNAIIGYASLLLDGTYGLIVEDQKIPLKGIQRNANDLLSLINNLLDLSKIESRKLRIDLGPVDVPSLIRDIVNGMQPLLDEKTLSVQFNLIEKPPTIVSDAMRVKQVIVNVLANAVKFTRQGGVTVQIKDVPQNEGIEITIRDTGIGMRPEELPKIFDPFHQVNAASTREFGGVGLGLAIVKQLVELLKGKISVQSEYGKGSAFTIFLPYRFQEVKETAPSG